MLRLLNYYWIMQRDMLRWPSLIIKMKCFINFWKNRYKVGLLYLCRANLFNNLAMIYNILLLIGANVLIPLIPIPPEVFLSYNVYDFNSLEPSLYQDMNISRVYTQ